jgi:hypothetical protein
MKDVIRGNSVAPELSNIFRFFHLQNPALDILRVSAQEIFDVIARYLLPAR